MASEWRRRGQWLRRKISQPFLTQHATPEQSRAMHLLWLDGILSSASLAFHGEFVVLYMLALGATSATVGLRASINSAVALAAPLLGAWLVSRTGERKRWVVLGPGIVARLALLLMAAIPLLASGSAAVGLFVALLALQAFFSGIGTPAHNSLLGDLVPLQIRGRFLGTVMMYNNIVTVLILPLAGWLVTQIGGLEGYQVIWLLAGLAGFAATSVYARIPEPESAEGPAHAAAGRAVSLWRRLGADRGFLIYCGIHFVWTFGIQVSAPFFTLHMVENLGFTADTIAYLTTVTTLFNVVALRLAGDLVDRYGAPRMTAIAMLLVPLMPVLWIFARTPFGVGVAKVYGFFAWAGFHVASLPFTLMMAPDEHRSQYLAILNTVAGVANVAAPFPAAWLYANMGFTSNLVLSAGGRLLAGILFALGLHKGWLLGSGRVSEGAAEVTAASEAGDP